MTTTHTRLKATVEKIANKLYSDKGVASSDDANSLNEFLPFYKGEITILSGTLPNTVNTPLSLFDDEVIRTETFICNNDASKVLSISIDAAGLQVVYNLDPKECISFPTSFNESIYIKASAPSLSFTAWVYTINV